MPRFTHHSFQYATQDFPRTVPQRVAMGELLKTTALGAWHGKQWEVRRIDRGNKLTYALVHDKLVRPDGSWPLGPTHEEFTEHDDAGKPVGVFELLLRGGPGDEKAVAPVTAAA